MPMDAQAFRQEFDFGIAKYQLWSEMFSKSRRVSRQKSSGMEGMEIQDALLSVLQSLTRTA
jgi:hypothetical protein